MSKCSRLKAHISLHAITDAASSRTCDGIAANTESTPFFGNCLGETDHTCFRNGVVGLSSVAVQTGGGGDVGDASVLLLTLIFDSEVWSGLTNNAGTQHQLHCRICT